MSLMQDRLAAIETELGRHGAILERLESAVIGNGSAGSSLRERVMSLETSNDWRHRGAYTGATAVVSAALAFIAHALTFSTQH